MLATAPTAQGVLVIDETDDRKDGHNTAHVSLKAVSGEFWAIFDNGVVVGAGICWPTNESYYPVDFEPYTPAVLLRQGKQDAALSQQAHDIALRLIRTCSRRRGSPFCAVVGGFLSYGEDRSFRHEAYESSSSTLCAGA